MTNKYFIYIKAHGYHCCDVERLKEISRDNIVEFKELIYSILNYPDKYNFTFTTELVRANTKSGWESEYKVYKMYPRIARKTIDKFMNYVPVGEIDTIEEIKILTTTEINIEDIK
jgi:hypothetical protein